MTKPSEKSETPRTDVIEERYAGAGTNFYAMAEHARSLERELSALRERTGWIATSERLPEAGREVLFFDALVRTACYGFKSRDDADSREWRDMTYQDCGMDRICWEVTHWQDLPAAPESRKP